VVTAHPFRDSATLADPKRGKRKPPPKRERRGTRGKGAAGAARIENEKAAQPTAFALYMAQTYPGASRAQLALLAIKDPRARELAIEGFNDDHA